MGPHDAGAYPHLALLLCCFSSFLSFSARRTVCNCPCRGHPCTQGLAVRQASTAHKPALLSLSQINVLAPMRLTRALAPKMVEKVQRRGYAALCSAARGSEAAARHSARVRACPPPSPPHTYTPGLWLVYLHRRRRGGSHWFAAGSSVPPARPRAKRAPPRSARLLQPAAPRADCRAAPTAPPQAPATPPTPPPSTRCAASASPPTRPCAAGACA